MSYLSLARRVPETSAVEPKVLTWFYNLIAQVPLVRTVHRHFVAGALAQEVSRGYGLDLGTGPGYVALQIARQRPGLKVVGLDLAAHMVGKARRQAAQAGLDGRGLWPQADGHRLPFPNGSFDLVVSSFALHHWDDPLCVFNEIARVLRPDGRYYIADVCREVNLFQRLFAYASIPAISLPFGSYLGYGGYYESVRAGYTRREARALLEHSALPLGEVRLDGTCFVPILTIAPRLPSKMTVNCRDHHPEAMGEQNSKPRHRHSLQGVD
jgi:ubiquinone/menaquinone biosynthesis C-methylase UbiE